MGIIKEKDNKANNVAINERKGQGSKWLTKGKYIKGGLLGQMG